MNKSLRSLIAIGVLSLLGAGFAFAAADKADAAKKTESKVANCCAKAKADSKTCAHACCVEAAKAGNNCTKCGGAGALKTEDDSTPKKKKKKKSEN